MLLSGYMANCIDVATSQPDGMVIGFFRLMWFPNLDTWSLDQENT
jgi:hypothetical protein